MEHLSGHPSLVTVMVLFMEDKQITNIYTMHINKLYI